MTMRPLMRLLMRLFVRLSVRRALGPSLALVALCAATLTGCGTEGGSASDPASPSSDASDASGPPSPADARIDFTEVALVSRTAAGGRVGERPVRLDDPAAVDSFTRQLRGHALGRKVAAAVRRADVPADRALLGAVVAVGCDVPPGVRVEDSDAGPRIVALPVASPRQECFAPVTTVAVVSVPVDSL